MPQMFRDKLPSKQNFYYSYDYEWVHFAALSIKDNFSRSGEQFKWLEKDLQLANMRMRDGGSIRWIVLMVHTPFYR
jgi:hypothetical protein